MQDRIKLAAKDTCTGCSACASICPKGCIKMVEDREGFLQPKVNLKACVRCHKCEKTCPILNPLTIPTDFETKAYAAINKDEEVRMHSSSGGMFHALAKWTIEQGGVVFGARFDEKWEVMHDYTETLEGIKPLMGSKYVQSRIGDSYKQAKQFLDQGRNVLFVGTPCQIGGLKSYLHKEYDNLLTVDFICIGIPSPKVWRKYINTYYRGECLQYINYKHKMRGWHHFTVWVETDRQVNCGDDGDTNRFMQSMFRTLSVRRSCFQCPFRTQKRISDITISDCWGAYTLVPDMDDNKGLSAIVVHSEKGQRILAASNVQMQGLDVTDIVAGNPNMVRDITLDLRRRKYFYKLLSFWPKAAFESYCNRTKFVVGRKSWLIKQILAPLRMMHIRQLISPNYWFLDYKMYNERYTYDMKLNEIWFQHPLTKEERNLYEIKYLKLYRKTQAAQNSIWFKYYYRRLKRLSLKSGIGLHVNLNINHGLVIGHAGPIIMNSNAVFKGDIMITHGVTVGRDIRGKRAGTPTFGHRVVLRTNSVITGNITIGDDVLIAPDTFVNFDVPNHSIVIGNPATIHHRENATEGHMPQIER